MDGPSRRSGGADGWTSIFPSLPGHHGVQDCDHWRLPSAQLSVTPGAPSLGEGPPDFTPPVMARRMLPPWIGFGDELPPSLLIHHGPGGSLAVWALAWDRRSTKLKDELDVFSHLGADVALQFSRREDVQEPTPIFALLSPQA